MRAYPEALGGVMETETSGAVADHEEAERERAEAERIAAEEALAAETPEPDTSEENADNPGVGQDVGDEPAEKPGPNEGPAPAQEPEGQGPYLDGPGQLSLNVGGKRPDGSSIRLAGGKIDMPRGEFKKGEEIVLMVRASVTGLAFIDKVDPKTHTVTGCDRRHTAQIRSVELLENE
jgi:hypothetical protein